MCRAVSSVMTRDGILMDAACLFQTPYYTLKYCMNITEAQDTLRSQIKTKSAGLFGS